MSSRWVRWIVLGIGTAAVAATLLPFVPTNEKWIRVWDYPRLQTAAILTAVLIAVPLLRGIDRRAKLSFMAAVMAALGWQIYRIWPYTPAFSTEATAAASCEAGSRLRLLVANVLIDNRDVQPLFALVDSVQPDVLLLVETDGWWDRQLEPLKSRFPEVVSHPQENGYGIHLFSRFPMIDPKVRFLIDDYVPSIKTGLRLPSGATVDLYGVHPKPPPLYDTGKRDAELLLIGREVRREGAPAIVAGDLNDVAWSRTTRLFQRTSGLLDPRVGRGPYATFNAKWPLLRWPLDHVFFEESFWLLEMAVMQDIHSDHYPFFVSVCHDPPAARAQDAPDPDAEDIDDATKAIRKGREEADDE